jgi:hypothetical protein
MDKGKKSRLTPLDKMTQQDKNAFKAQMNSRFPKK